MSSVGSSNVLASPTPPAAGLRLPRLDALRALAMVWMTAFHFCFDLSHFGWWPQNFRADPVWTWQRTCIVSLFLLCAGWGQAVAWQQGLPWARFWRRWMWIAACALCVTAGSFVMFPRSYIYFGVLHGMAVMLLVARVTAPWRTHLWWLGALAVVSPWLAQWALPAAGPQVAAVLDGRALNWLGWVTRKPFTEDYVPVFPWLGVVWWGVASGQWILRYRPQWWAGAAEGGEPRWLASLAWLGRHSLGYYMLHQPVLIGGLMAVGWWVGKAH